MLRRLSSSAIIALLVLAACAGGASPAPTAGPSTPPPATPAPTPIATPIATAVATLTVEPSPVPSAAADTVTTSIVDVAGTDELLAKVPAGWITITARDIANESSFATWRAAHPEVSADSATTVADDMSTGGVSLFAFDAENAVNGFTPNLNVTWVDAPVSGLEAWVAGQAASITKEYGLASALAYSAWTPSGPGAVGGFVGAYRYTMKGSALAGSQMIVPMPDGRAAVLTFTCRDNQTDLFSPVLEALFTSLSARS
jgi:hypothetical protein